MATDADTDARNTEPILYGRSKSMADNILQPGTPLATYFQDARSQIGVTHRQYLGVLDAVAIGRFAISIGASNPVHYDRCAAQEAGFADVVAPANMLAALVQWGPGAPVDRLHPNGVPIDYPGVASNPDVRLRAMGAGEHLEFVSPATAGMRVVRETTIESVVPKSTRGGPCVFVTTVSDYLTDDGNLLNHNTHTIAMRNPHAEF